MKIDNHVLILHCAELVMCPNGRMKGNRKILISVIAIAILTISTKAKTILINFFSGYYVSATLEQNKRNLRMDLLRPFEEPDLRIIMPNPVRNLRMDLLRPFEEPDLRIIMPNPVRNLRMDLLRPFEEPDLRIIMPNPVSSETDEEISASERRRYKAYTVMQRSEMVFYYKQKL
ncbi:hypothetical protein DICVIV_01160 [Dictyocaulus viviparus]|uniref:Uncharacterized protein n=1 Tax=Dictyocaulus viviparus TaxID=29172 RepID=A0A0D8Y9R3_DICVI|nr:hypothetical protein DICVIV_01160 [Dictyocaulus viviparus]